MSDVFMDMQRRRHRWHNQQNIPAAPTASATTARTTSDSASSAQQHLNFQIFSHRSKKNSTAGESTDHHVNHNFNNRKNSHDNVADADDAIENILSLKLKKPKHWKWELSTSKSCSSIALPRILLYDHKGELLVDVQGEGVCQQNDQHNTKYEKSKKRCHQSTPNQLEYQQQAATVNLTHSIRQALENEFNSLHIQEATPSPQPISPANSLHCSSSKAIDFSTNDLSDYELSRRSSSLRGVRFNTENGKVEPMNESHVPEFLPTPPSTATPTTSSSSGPREKRKYRRSLSSGRSSGHSESILERFSYQRGRFSSPEYAEETKVQHGPRYFLRTCKAGTLLIKEDSFSQHPRRRRRLIKNRSTESLKSVQMSPFSTSLQTRQLLYSMSPTPSDINCKRKLQPLHHHLTDRNNALNKQLSTSEEELVKSAIRKPFINNANENHLRKCSQSQNQTKDLNYAATVYQNGKIR